VNPVAALLPGLRDFRVPLTVGLTYMMCLWLLFHGDLPSAGEATGIVAAAYDLVELIGASAGLAVLVFGAYLAGNLVTFSWLREVPLGWVLKRDPDTRGFLRSSFNAIDVSTLADLYGQTRDRLSAPGFDYEQRDNAGANRKDVLDRVGLDEPEDERASLGERQDLVKAIARTVLDEIPTSIRRLRLASPDAFASYDQKASEAQFRQAISFPLLALIVCVGFVENAWWLVFIFAPALLWVQGVRRAQEARSDLMQAVLQDVSHSSLFDYIRHLGHNNGWK
jgi:hypothetical protein